MLCKRDAGPQIRDLECVNENNFSYFSTKTYVVGTQKNRLDELPKHMFKLMDKKIVTILRLKTFD